MFQRLIHYLESGTDDVHGYVKELKEAEEKATATRFIVTQQQVAIEEYLGTIKELEQRIQKKNTKLFMNESDLARRTATAGKLEQQLAEANEIIKEYANSKWERIARPAQDYIDNHNL